MAAIASIYAYPWDLYDEGIARALDVITGVAGQTEVSMACNYHVGTFFLPHNPRRKIYFGEDGVVFFQPTVNPYPGSRIRARVSRLADSAGYLPALAEECRQRGVDFTAWVVYCFNHYLARSFPQCAKQDALGNPYLSQLCPANPDVRAYCKEMTRDLCRQCHPQGLHLESLSYLCFDYGFLIPKIGAPIAALDRFLLGICFCDHCIAAATAAGLDGEAFRSRVADYLEESLPGDPGPEAERLLPPEVIAEAFDGELLAYLQARAEAATSLYEEVAGIGREEGVRHIRCVLPTVQMQPLTGLIPERVLAVTDRLLSELPDPDSLGRLSEAKQNLPSGALLMASVEPEQIRDGAALRERLLACREAGVSGFTFYNYGMLRLHQLEAIGAARDAWQ